MNQLSGFSRALIGFAAFWLGASLGSAQALQDPTKPNGFSASRAETVPQRSYTLASIIIGQDRKVAVIDGQALREGQVFDGVRVRRIYPDRVELIEQGSVRVIRLSTLPQVRSIE